MRRLLSSLADMAAVPVFLFLWSVVSVLDWALLQLDKWDGNVQDADL